ncbi:MAG: primosomal protein N' [Oscillospiraceae bacterium]
MAITALVAVNNATFHFDKLYSYLVPVHLQQSVFAGSMVLVPFGRGSAPRMGVVLGIENTEETSKLKPIYDAAPEKACLTHELLQLVYYLKQQTFCTYYEAVKTVIPYGAQYKAIIVNGAPTLQKQLRRHTETYYSLGTDMPLKPTEKQSIAINMLQSGQQPRSALELAGVTKSVLDNLCKKNALISCEKDKILALYENEYPKADSITLSKEQQAVFEALLKPLSEDKAHTSLLYGVTSSGKTLVFIKLIEAALAQNKQALVLVPEISLTPQMIYRLKGFFGSRVAVQHSALSHTERLLQWQLIQNGGADIVVGTRSAVFAPLPNLGLIIIDEEQERTYHSDSSPRFDARELARMRAKENKALLLLASATPSVETFYAAQSGKIGLVTLDKRYNDMPLPKVRLVDMRAELASGNTGGVSRELAEEIAKNIRDKKQTILLLNRRGYKTVGMCTSCCEVYKCAACSVPMVYHKAEDKLLCHYCGSAVSPLPEVCPKCGGKLRFTGFGTQRAEEELQTLFPTARILRMDTDTTSGKNSHEDMLRRFDKGEYDIMLGTQMVAKGLDFEKVTLVGVLGIDQLLFAQGYKAFENVFSLVTQVVGRGGRANSPGRAIIQTVDINHPVLNLAARQDYRAFYKEEIAFRKLNIYPPFCTICMLGFGGAVEENVLFAARHFAKILAEFAEKCDKIPLRILGPAPMNILMINNSYRYKLTVKCRNDKQFRSLMNDALVAYNKEGLVNKASVYLDFNSDADI